MYQSDFTRFIKDFLQENPQVDIQREQLRQTWWDRHPDLDDQRRWRESGIPQKPYVYQPD